MLSFLSWYLVTCALGWAAFPLIYHLLPSLPDRGLAASRALGLLLWGYSFWLLASLGILPNSPSGLLFAFLLLCAFSVWSIRKQRRAAWNWLKSKLGLVFTIEILFLLAFIFLALVRAANPEAVGTEKPMELAFINAILKSTAFPPHDPWLSGYAISYYYFGYVLVAMLAKITGVSGAIAFNLGSALVFALSACGAYGLLYNLLAVFRRSQPGKETPASISPLTPLLGPLFVLLVSNLEGFLHALHTRAIFWQRNEVGILTSNFWKWLDIKDLTIPPAEPFSWVPNSFWWWWRASRVLLDYDAAGNSKEIIDEFPFFSYLLGDLHPHVLAMPFVLLGMTLALNLLLTQNQQNLSLQMRLNRRTAAWSGLVGGGLSLLASLVAMLAGIIKLRPSFLFLGAALFVLGGMLLISMFRMHSQHGSAIFQRPDLGEISLGAVFEIEPLSFLLAAIVLGSMAFLNTWDFPFAVALFAAVYAIKQCSSPTHPKTLLEALPDFLLIGAALGASGGLLYLPFYAGFSSQAGGIVPNLIYPVRGAHLWVMFAPLLIPLFAFLLYLLRQKNSASFPWWQGFAWAFGFVLVAWGTSLFMSLGLMMAPQTAQLFLGSLNAQTGGQAFTLALQRRLLYAGGWLTLTFLLALSLNALLKLLPETLDRQVETPPTTAAPQKLTQPPSHSFVLLLILLGILLVLGPEFFFLQDQFGWRMNTIFKFYFHAWLLWGIAAAYASAILLEKLRPPEAAASSVIFRLGWSLLVIISLCYPIFGLWNKTNGFKPGQWTLDSTAYLQSSSPDELVAAEWLRNLDSDDPSSLIIAEAVASSGGSYTNYARMATLSGLPSVLGWMGHESQWRGGGKEMGARQSDLEKLYCSRTWEDAQAILNRYQIRYVVVGSLERSTYRSGQPSCPTGVMDAKFMRYMQVAFQFETITIYEYGSISALPSRP